MNVTNPSRDDPGEQPADEITLLAAVVRRALGGYKVTETRETRERREPAQGCHPARVPASASSSEPRSHASASPTRTRWPGCSSAGFWTFWTRPTRARARRADDRPCAQRRRAWQASQRAPGQADAGAPGADLRGDPLRQLRGGGRPRRRSVQGDALQLALARATGRGGAAARPVGGDGRRLVRSRRGAGYRLFSAAVSRAVAESEVALVRRVKEADDWRASAWMLERRFQDRWRRRDHVEVSGEGHALPPVPAGRVVVEDPVARELARKLRERISGWGQQDDDEDQEDDRGR